VNDLVRVYVDIALLRRGPEDLPYSRAVLLRALAWYVASGLLLFQIHVPVFLDALSELLVSLLLEMLFFVALLQFAGKAARIMQTLTAVAGTGVLFTVLALPLHWWIQGAPAGAGQGLPQAAVLMLLVWSFLTGGHILRRALEIPLVGGVVLVLAEFILAVAVTRQIFGEAA